jgi:HAD superfamily hydrolase (TIGR01549 family)
MPIKAVLFDMFDTLMLIEKNHEFYSPALLRMFTYLNKHGITVSFDKFNAAYVEARDRINARVEDSFEEPHFNVRVFETLKSLGFDYEVSSPLVEAATNEFCEEFMTYVQIDVYAKAMLKTLHSKYKLGIVSNFAIPECVFKLIEAEGLDSFFDVVIVSAAVNKRKPCPEIFQDALKALDVSVEEAVFVGDTIDSDIEGAKGVGMKAVYIERRMQKSDKVSPDFTIKNLDELLKTIDKC